MALRVLSDEERQSLKESTTFLQKCEWAVRNYADYWSVHTGSGLVDTEAARIKWLKDRLVGVNVVMTDINDSDLTLKFVKLGKGIQYDLNPSPESVDTIIAAMVAGSRFDELASSYFTLRGESIDFTVGGN